MAKIIAIKDMFLGEISKPSLWWELLDYSKIQLFPWTNAIEILCHGEKKVPDQCQIWGLIDSHNFKPQD